MVNNIWSSYGYISSSMILASNKMSRRSCVGTQKKAMKPPDLLFMWWEITLLLMVSLVLSCSLMFSRSSSSHAVDWQTVIFLPLHKFSEWQAQGFSMAFPKMMFMRACRPYPILLHLYNCWKKRWPRAWSVNSRLSLLGSSGPGPCQHWLKIHIQPPGYY